MEKYIPIPRSEGGILATLNAMKEEALRVRTPVEMTIPLPRHMDHYLRQRWDWIENRRMEFRSLNRQIGYWLAKERFVGACADAATVAAWILYQRLFGYRVFGEDFKCWFVALRFPHRPDFSHVFVRCMDRYGTFNIDPTVEQSGDYRNCETLTLPLF